MKMKKYDYLISLIILIAMAWLFWQSGTRALWDPDEARYAEMGREVLALNDWLTPHLNYLPYFEKPMLFIWMEAFSQRVLGSTESAARIPPLICAMGCVALTGLLGMRQWGLRAGLIAAVVLLSSVEFFFLAHTVDINMPLAFFITATLACFWLAHFQNRQRLYYLAWICAGLATLTKGPAGFVLPAVAIFMYILATRQFRLLLNIKPVAGILLFFLTAAPWYILVCRRNPEFFDFFFINQNLMRYTSTIHERYEPFWYFVPVLAAGFMPWTILLPRIIRRIRDLRPALASPAGFAFIWFAVMFLFFIPSQSKLATYILPCFMPLALLTGYALQGDRKKPGPLFACAAGLWLITAVMLFLLPFIGPAGWPAAFDHSGRITPVLQYGLLMGGLILGGTLPAILAARIYGAVPGFALLGVTLMFFGLVFGQAWDDMRSTRNLVDLLPPDSQLYAYGKYYHSAGFYSAKPVHLVGVRGELVFGQSLDNSLTVSPDEFFRRLQTGDHVFCITNMRRFRASLGNVPYVRVIARQDDMLLISGPGSGDVTNGSGKPE